VAIGEIGIGEGAGKAAGEPTGSTGSCTMYVVVTGGTSGAVKVGASWYTYVVSAGERMMPSGMADGTPNPPAGAMNGPFVMVSLTIPAGVAVVVVVVVAVAGLRDTFSLIFSENLS